MAELTEQQREDREKAIQKVCDYYPHLKGSGDDFIMKMTPGMVMFAECAIRAERERDGAVRTLQTVRSGFSASHYVARVIDAWSQAAHPANGGSTMANEYPYDQTSNQPAQVGDFHQAVLDSRAAEQAVTHADPVPSPLPESVRKPDYTSQSAPEPVEQGEQKEGFYETLDRKCWENSGTAQLLRERPENLHDYQGCVNDPKMQPSPSAPSQPELEPLSKPITTSKYWDASIDWPLAGERAARLERQDQLLAALRETQQLQKQIDRLATNCKVFHDQIEADNAALVEENNKLQQQLAQIKECKSERPKNKRTSGWGFTYQVSDVDPLLDQQDAKIAALKLDNAQKAKRIAELEGGK
jgi:hypothetical protein